jgi:hypothetical protein
MIAERANIAEIVEKTGRALREIELSSGVALKAAWVSQRIRETG